jgi:hypothetical protein
MVNTIQAKRNFFKRRWLLLLVVLLFVVAVTLLILEKANVINLYTKSINSTLSQDDNSETTSSAVSAQAEFTDGDSRTITRTTPNDGLVIDNAGNIANLPPENQWLKSTNGEITLYSPGRNMIVSNGSILSGATNVNKVSFRLIDDVSGVISRGELNVVNGKFSGTFSFQTTADIGRLDIFSTSADGLEINNIEVPISFR